MAERIELERSYGKLTLPKGYRPVIKGSKGTPVFNGNGPIPAPNSLQEGFCGKDGQVYVWMRDGSEAVLKQLPTAAEFTAAWEGVLNGEPQIDLMADD